MFYLQIQMETYALVLGTCLLLSYSGTVQATYKKWVPNTNFDNPSNWNAGRLPCKNDVVKFPESVPPVYIQMNASVQEIVLPMNGKLILADFMSLRFPSGSGSGGSGSDSDCVGRDIQFNRTTAQSWFDPKNWCDVTDREGSCLSEPSPRLATETLPCRTDAVVFPADASFLVDMKSGVDIHVGKLFMKGKEYSTGNFRNYLRSDDGRKAFQSSGGDTSTGVNIAGNLCNDPTGCPCGNSGTLLEDKVCDEVRDTCPGLLCTKPLLPEGSCCHICGAVMILDYGPGFRFKTLATAAQSSVSRLLKSSVRVIVSKTTSEQIQVVVEDVDGSGHANEVLTIIRNKINPDASGNSRYRIIHIEVTLSDTEGPAGNTGTQEQNGGAGSSTWGGGSIASLVVAVLAVLAIVIIAMYCLIDRKRPSANNNRSKFSLPVVQWPFRRFGQEDDRGALELGPSVVFKDNVSFRGRGRRDGPETVRGFDNPTYGEPGMMNGQSVEGATGYGAGPVDVNTPTFVRKGKEAGFSNPLYGGDQKIEDLSYLDSTLKMNPMFSADGMEEDSEI